MTCSLADAAIEILQRTRDGEDLDPKHLKLVELAVNGVLNATGFLVFQELLEQVRKGYTKPWFHGVEHVTRNHEGYVLWRGVAIEHFNAAYANSDEAETYVKELARRCAIVEAKGIAPNTNHVVWRWQH
jgi:hypothetical protein